MLPRKYSGCRNGAIYGVEQVYIGGRQVFREHVMSIKDLSPRERLLRMGMSNKPGVALVKGLMAYAAGSYEYAGKYFEATHPTIRERLMKRIPERVAPHRSIGQ